MEQLLKVTFPMGLLDGKGTQKNKNGYTYSGDWKTGEKSGIAIINYDGGGKYEGVF